MLHRSPMNFKTHQSWIPLFAIKSEFLRIFYQIFLQWARLETNNSKNDSKFTPYLTYDMVWISNNVRSCQYTKNKWIATFLSVLNFYWLFYGLRSMLSLNVTTTLLSKIYYQTIIQRWTCHYSRFPLVFAATLSQTCYSLSTALYIETVTRLSQVCYNLIIKFHTDFLQSFQLTIINY